MTYSLLRATAMAAIALLIPAGATADSGHGNTSAGSRGHMSGGGHMSDGGHMSEGGHMSDGAHGHGGAIGKPGKPSDASRTVEVVMHDNYYEPESITVKAGETIRFKARNAGQLVHEFNIGTPQMHKAHGPEMLEMMQQGVLMPDHIDEQAAKAMQGSMGHDDPNSVLLEPGETGEVVWTFAKDAKVDLQFACNVPGHREAGMVGDFRMNHGH